MTRIEQLQQCDKWFKEMREKVEIGCDNGRPGWMDEPVDYLISRFHEELGEFFRNPTRREAADVANLIFMIQERKAKDL